MTMHSWQGSVSAMEFEVALREQLRDYAQRRLFYNCCTLFETEAAMAPFSSAYSKACCAPAAAMDDLRLLTIATQGGPAIYSVGSRSVYSSATILKGPSPQLGTQLSFCRTQLQPQCLDRQGQVQEHLIPMHTGNAAPRALVQSPLHASLVEVMAKIGVAPRHCRCVGACEIKCAYRLHKACLMTLC